MNKAPWSQDHVDALNAGQKRPDRHPYTCPGDEPDCEKHRNLIATTEGWVCACGKYKQDWSH